MSQANEYTGKKYKCKSLVEINQSNWASNFKVGKKYNELKNNNLPCSVLMLEPSGKNWELTGLYVDACQFELITNEN